MLQETPNAELEDRFNRLYEKTVRQTTAYLMPRCRRPADLDDLLQETYLELYRALNRPGFLRRLRSGEALVRQIAKQRLYRYYRRTEGLYEFSLVLPVGDEDDLSVNMGDIRQLEHFLESAPDDLEFDRLVMAVIQEELRNASEIDRRIVTMRYGLELSLEEIAGALDCPVGTVKSRLYRFLKKMRDAGEKRQQGGFK